jgi:hypothetical protein
MGTVVPLAKVALETAIGFGVGTELDVELQPAVDTARTIGIAIAKRAPRITRNMSSFLPMFRIAIGVTAPFQLHDNGRPLGCRHYPRADGTCQIYTDDDESSTIEMSDPPSRRVGADRRVLCAWRLSAMHSSPLVAHSRHVARVISLGMLFSPRFRLCC